MRLLWITHWCAKYSFTHLITLCCLRCGRLTSRAFWPAFVTSLATTSGSSRYYVNLVQLILKIEMKLKIETKTKTTSILIMDL